MKDFDRSYFQVIDSEDKAYWLGFFYADGYVYKSGKQISITLSERDADHLQKFADIFQSHLKPYSYIDKRTDNRYTTVRCAVSSKQICQDLESKGIKNAKSLKGGDEVLSSVPDNLKHHFIRGYFDGDGCISKNHRGECVFSLAGTQPFLETVRNYISDVLTMNDVQLQPRKKIFALAWGGNWQLQDLREWLYEDATIWLERKRKKFARIEPGHSGKTSKHRNVSWCNTRQKWVVRKMVKGKDVWGGSFSTEDEAICASLLL